MEPTKKRIYNFLFKFLLIYDSDLTFIIKFSFKVHVKKKQRIILNQGSV